jgi:predicted DNA-binding transcriptional regulator AlpA
MTGRYLSAEDIHVALSVSRSTAYDVLSNARCVKFGSTVRVAESAFQRWLDHHKVMPTPPHSLFARLLPAGTWSRVRQRETDSPDAAEELIDGVVRRRSA